MWPQFRVVLAIDEEEAKAMLEENTIVMFAGPFAQEIFNQLNEYIAMTESDLQERKEREPSHRYFRTTQINLADFGLSYPVTIQAYIENWEAVKDVILVLDLEESDHLGEKRSNR